MLATDQNPVETLQDYDEVPYPGSAFPNSHPSHLAAVARACGLTPPAPNDCRVLELGSSMGANLIPMAEGLPGSHFVGIDLSSRQIAQAHATLAEINLNNIEFHHLNIADVDEGLGKFDYVICHGVYSWVPRDVQDKILRIGRERLNENGIMYVSYNTYPGWHLRGAVRDMMRYHAANFNTPQEKIGQARELLKFLAESARTHFEAYPKLLEQEAESLSHRSDSYIFHEFLENINEPLYFHEFLDRVESSGLRYFADAEMKTMMAQFFDENVSALLRKLPMLKREQYMDFLRSRAFRVSLLCHSELNPNYNVSASCLLPMQVSLHTPLQEKPGEADSVIWTHPRGTMTTTSPMTEVLRLLNTRWPKWVPVQELVAGPLTQAPQDAEVYLRDLFVGMLRGVLRIADQPPDVASRISEMPLCSPYVRWQARHGETLTNRRHNDVSCQRLTRLIAENVDGQNTLEDLAEIVKQAAASGQFKITRGDESMDDTESVNWLPVVQQELARLATGSLLVS